MPASRLHQPKGLTGVERAALDYPEPIVDHQQARIRAIEAFELLVQLLPNNLSAVYELAQAYEMKGDWEGAIRNLERIIELDPKFVTALFAMETA